MVDMSSIWHAMWKARDLPRLKYVMLAVAGQWWMHTSHLYPILQCCRVGSLSAAHLLLSGQWGPDYPVIPGTSAAPRFGYRRIHWWEASQLQKLLRSRLNTFWLQTIDHESQGYSALKQPYAKVSLIRTIVLLPARLTSACLKHPTLLLVDSFESIQLDGKVWNDLCQEWVVFQELLKQRR